MMNLDDMAAIRAADPEGMLDRINELDRQLIDSAANAAQFQLPEDYKRIENIAILGMGGSAIAGDLTRTLVANECPVPIQIVREYELPQSVNDRSLVIASSYSGGTEETLSALKQAVARGARVVVITTGGKLAEEAALRGYPLLRFSYSSQPRAALGHSIVPVLIILYQLDLIADPSSGLSEATKVIAELRNNVIGADVPLRDNPAKQLAQTLSGKFPIIYGGGIFSEVARRWKGQFNENAKNFAAYDQFPELNHNAVVGYEYPQEILQHLFIILLHSDTLHPRLRARYQITQKILEQRGIQHQQIEARGEQPLAQMFSLITYGDFVTYYLALLDGADPTPVKSIDYLKSQLAELQE